VIKNLIKEIALLDENASEKTIQQLFRRFPKAESGLYRKSDLLEELNSNLSDFSDLDIKKIKRLMMMKETRTISGVTPVTVLTKPFPCPGKCIFCPNDVRMPKSYLSDEPGAQRATRNHFNPYAQTFNRLLAYKTIGHSTDKIELIILGGTWTSYPENYQIWFVKRCFDAINDFEKKSEKLKIFETSADLMPFSEETLTEIDGSQIAKTYNQIISMALIPKKDQAKTEDATWQELFEAQEQNTNAKSRCVGLVIETRPDEINENEIIRIRKLGATKTQIGFQSLNDEVLTLNKRGHDVKTTAHAVKLLRQAGFKIHAHWMPNLYGSTPEKDIEDYKKIFENPDFKPDEIKIYPCSLIASAELMQYYRKGLWKPYTREELIGVLTQAYKMTPAYCRITRMIRDIGSQDIVVGNKKTNLRENVEKNIQTENFKPLEIRAREIRGSKPPKGELILKVNTYETSCSTEYFLEFVDEQYRIYGFLRLSIPHLDSFIEELKASTIIREVHIYGQSLELGSKSEDKPQHMGLGKALIAKAEEISIEKGFKRISVISSIGTREYYKKLGYKLKNLYQTKVVP
jgi:elongator complex protein 3